MPFPIQRVGFQTKVLVPVVALMVLLVALTMWVVNHRITRQLEREASHSLLTAEAVFKNTLSIRTKNLLLRFRNIPNEPRYRAVFQLSEPKTIREFLNGLLGGELGGDLLQYKTADRKLVANARRNPALDLTEFETRGAKSAELALEGMGNVDTIRVGHHLFDIVSVPVTVGEQIIGVLTFGVEIGESEASDLSQVTRCGVVLLAENSVAAASLQQGDLFRQCLALFGSVPAPAASTAAGGDATIRNITLPEEHFLGLVGKFTSLNGDPDLGYVLLYSYEPALRELRATQRTIVWVSLGGILLSTAVVWFFIRQVTRPLRQLRDSAEAVGRGDFTRRVHVASKDECGELAEVFNHMTENLSASRRELEQTVDRLKTTQVQLIQREKLSAIGEFVAGVTHELNNPLTGLLGFAELLQSTPVTEQQRRFTDRIVQSAQRCHKIVRGLLSFARQNAPERKLTDLNQLIENTLELMAYEMRTSNIQVITQLTPALPPVVADAQQIQQVFLNLVNNSRQAIEAHQPGGQLRVRTEAADGRVRVTIQDNGPGISEENLKKIFNPFFTTKEVGKGTGLGLSVSYGIIEEHGGTITVQSQLGQGATFTVELPAAPASRVATTPPASTKPAETVLSGKGKRVLIIDDEQPILDFVGEVLRHDGYQVDTASDGETALRYLRQADYDLTLCDWKMPGLNGQQVFATLRVEDPEAAHRFVFMTGDVINERIQHFLKEHTKACMAKPFSLADFRAAVGKLTKAA